MLFGDINFSVLLFFLILFSISVNVNTALHLLLTAELLWISLYVIVLLTGLIFDNINMLSLTFFFLILSAVEFGLGLVIMLVQHIILRSISLNDLNYNSFKFSSRFLKKINTHNPNLL
jgi:NADH:ubiquinone oxidoreductase subunit K